jgi:hypothetical protein
MKKHTTITLLAMAGALILAACGDKTPAQSSGGSNAAAEAQRAADTAAQTYTEALKTVAETAQDVIAIPSGDSDTALSAPGWEQALDDYEQFVDEYAVFMKQYAANPGDMAMLGKYASMMTQAQTAMESMSQVEADLSGADLAKFSERYLKITAKLTAAIQ